MTPMRVPGAAHVATTGIPAMNDPVFVNLIEPHPIAFSGNDDLGIWEYDKLVVIRIGSSTDIGAETIGIRKELLGPVWRTLKSIDERDA